jgi:predicted GH43/DUF377 family glycosyl hydrolase
VQAAAVVLHEGTFYLFRKGFSSREPEIGAVGLSTSQDGIHWTQQPDPLFTDLGLPVVAPGVLPSTILIDDGGTWVMYLWGATPSAGHPLGQIWRATAPAPEGPWTAYPEPILPLGPSGAWDSAAVLTPSVVLTDEGYLMFYDAWGTTSDIGGIGRATSEDGIHWVKYDDPATQEPLYQESDPVFPAGSRTDWDARTMRPSVVSTPDGLVMAYMGFTDNQPSTSFGLAFSHDGGITWERYSGNPVITRTDIPDISYLNEQKLFYADGTYYLFVQAGGDRAGTDIWLARVEAPLPK